MSYHDWERRQGEIDSELTKNPLRQRWACLDGNNRIIACGITAQGKFDMRRMNLTSLGAADWIEGGQRYCEVWTFKGIGHGVYIDEISHGHIRCGRAKLQRQ